MARRFGLIAVLGAALASLAFGVGKADAGLLGCRYDPATQAFAQWGDNANYVPVPGGSFEGSSGWRLSGGAQIVDGNEPFDVGSSGGSHSLLLPPGSTAISPATCLGILTPTLRFVGNSSDGSGVHVTLYTRTLLGLVQLPTSSNMTLSTDWNPSSINSFVLQNVLGLLSLSQANVYFGFSPVGDATVQMDDVLLDPYIMR